MRRPVREAIQCFGRAADSPDRFSYAPRRFRTLVAYSIMRSFDLRLAPRDRLALRRTGFASRRAVAAAACLWLIGCAQTPNAREPEPFIGGLPPSLAADTHEIFLESLNAAGEATYRCEPAGGRLVWTPVGTEATLVDSARRNVGALVPGERFVAFDGSDVVGHVASEAIVSAGALPWQHIVAPAHSHPAQSAGGRFTEVTSIQRVSTRGGLPPRADCSVIGLSELVPYFATYRFFKRDAPQG